MRIVNFETRGVPGIAADEGAGWHGLSRPDSGFPGTLPELIAQGADLSRIGRTLGQSEGIDLKAVRLLPQVPAPPKRRSQLRGSPGGERAEEAGVSGNLRPASRRV